MAFNFATLTDSLQGAASSGAFGQTVQQFSGAFGGNPPPVSARPLLIQTVPMTVNPAANPSAAITNTSAPSASFMKTLGGVGINPTTIIVGLAVLVVLAVVVIKSK